MSEYETRLVGLAQACALVKIAAESLSSVTPDGDDDGRALQTILKCRDLLADAQRAAPGLCDVYTVNGSLSLLRA